MNYYLKRIFANKGARGGKEERGNRTYDLSSFYIIARSNARRNVSRFFLFPYITVVEKHIMVNSPTLSFSVCFNKRSAMMKQAGDRQTKDVDYREQYF